MGNFICSQNPQGTDELHEKQQQAYLRTMDQRNGALPNIRSTLSDNPRTALQLRSAFYGMGDFMSGVSDSSSNDSRFMLRIGMQRSDHYQRNMFRGAKTPHKLQLLTQYAACQRSITQRARSQSLIVQSPSGLLGSGSEDSRGSRKSLGRVCREFYEVSEQKKLVERQKPQEIRQRVCQKCKGRKHKSKQSQPNGSIKSPGKASQPDSLPKQRSQEKKSADRAEEKDPIVLGLFANITRQFSSLGGHLQPPQANNSSEQNPFDDKQNSNHSNHALTFKPDSRKRYPKSSSRKKLSTTTFNQSGKKRSDRLTNGLTFSDRDVDIQSCYGGGIIIDKKRKLFENLSEHMDIGCCLELGQRFERQNTLEQGLSSPAPSSQKRQKVKRPAGAPRSQGNHCACFSDFDSGSEGSAADHKRRLVGSTSHVCDSYFEEEPEFEFEGSNGAYEAPTNGRKTFKSQGDLIKMQQEMDLLIQKDVLSETTKPVTVQSN